MSNTKLLSDFLKSLTTTDNVNGKNLIVFDASGNPSKISKSGLVPTDISIRNQGAFALQERGIYLCFAYNESNHFEYCFFIVSVMPYDGKTNNSPFVELKSNGLTVYNINAFGTTAIRKSDGSEPGDTVKIRAVRFPY